VKPRRAAGKKGCFRPLDSASGPPTFFKQVAWHQQGVPAWASAQRCISTGLAPGAPSPLGRGLAGLSAGGRAAAGVSVFFCSFAAAAG